MGINDQIRQLRGDKTLDEFSAQIHCTTSTLRNYESGKVSPTVATLQSIADATNTRLTIEFKENEQSQPDNQERLEEEKVDMEINRLSKLMPKQNVTEKDMADMIKNGEW